MDLIALESWFKNSIPGLVLLGAIGSMLALWLFRLSRYLWNFGVAGRRAFLRWEYKKGWGVGVVAASFQLAKDPIVAMAWYAQTLASLFLALILFLVVFILLLYMLQATTGDILTVSSLALAVLAFLLLRWAYEKHRDINTNFKWIVQPIIDKAVEAKSAKMRRENTDKP